MPEHQQTHQSKESKSTAQKQATPRIQAPISHPMAVIQRVRINPKSLTHADVMQLQSTIGNRAVGRLLSEIGLIPSKAKQAPPVQRQEVVQRQEIPEEEEPLQGKFENKPYQMACPSCFAAPIVQRQEIPEEEETLQGKFENIQRQEISEEKPLQPKRENNTGMPDNLKAGVESLSGIDMSDVRVHYNSSKPADVGALAYTQGTNIHVAPGQERHLPHEAWHVVQQKQGRVKPTMQMKDGVPVNDDEGLEHEADVMGEAVPIKEGMDDAGSSLGVDIVHNDKSTAQCSQVWPVTQRVVKIKTPLEFNTPIVVGNQVLKNPPEYLEADVDGGLYRLKAGQDFINDVTGAEYMADKNKIKGSDAKLHKPMSGPSDNYEEDVRVVGDGHHKLLFSTYHASSCAGGLKNFPAKAYPWSGLKWKKKP